MVRSMVSFEDQLMRRFVLLCAVASLCGCTTPNREPASARTARLPVQPTAVVFVANGAGDGRTFSTNLQEVVEGTGTPLQVELVEWSRGFGRYIADQVDRDNQREQGRRLAARVQAYHCAYPQRRIYLAGHSAGCAVVLHAAEMLPENSVDRILLLSPSVSATYDLRPALRTARCGIDAFHSSRDGFILGLGMAIVGTTDGGRNAAGRYGFVPVGSTFADATLYTKLHQHPWDRAVQWAGHAGGHMGDVQADYLLAYVMPLMQESR
jgi:pimeloyl-ACP methyl ester carboxylesterase